VKEVQSMDALTDRATTPERVLGLARRWLPRATDRVLGTLVCAATSDPVVALTFDDGPHPATTPAVLQLLSAYGARATFFMLGKAAATYPTLVQQVAAAGHAIGNHSWDHPSFPALSSRERRAQIAACRRAIAPYGDRLFRPPYGDQDIASRLDALRTRHQVVTWSVDTGDWHGEAPGVIVYRIVAEVRPGSIVLLHDGDPAALDGATVDRSATLRALDLALRRLRGAYAFVTIPELLRRGRPRRMLWIQSGGPASDGP
jgi:peptidoglycan/xylan/chitin deacetylase (PgdA/CDA1 family)